MRTPDAYCGDCRDVRLLYITTEKVVVCMGAHFTVIYICVCVCVFVLHCSIIRLMTLTSIFLIPLNMFSTIIFQLRMTSFHVFPENDFFPPAITLIF